MPVCRAALIRIGLGVDPLDGGEPGLDLATARTASHASPNTRNLLSPSPRGFTETPPWASTASSMTSSCCSSARIITVGRLLPQPRAALDVGEDERDDAVGEFSHRVSVFPYCSSWSIRHQLLLAPRSLGREVSHVRVESSWAPPRFRGVGAPSRAHTRVPRGPGALDRRLRSPRGLPLPRSSG